MEKETEIKHKREREGETQRGNDREVSSTPDRSTKEVSLKQQDRHEKNGLAPLRSASLRSHRSRSVAEKTLIACAYLYQVGL